MTLEDSDMYGVAPDDDIELDSLSGDPEASTRWDAKAFETLIAEEPPKIPLVRHIDQTRGRFMQACEGDLVVGPTRPAALQISKMFGHRNPELPEILADYSLMPEIGDGGLEESFFLSFEQLMATFLRLYADLKDRFNIEEKQWDDIKSYLAKELARYINAGKLGPQNMGLTTKAFTPESLEQAIQDQISSSKDSGFYWNVFKNTLDRLFPDIDGVFEKIIGYSFDLLEIEAYEGEINRRLPIRGRASTRKRAAIKKAIDTEYGGEGEFGREFTGRLLEAFRKDLASHLANPARPWKRLASLSANLGHHTDTDQTDIEARVQAHVVANSDYAGVMREESEKIEAGFRQQLMIVLRKQAIELFEGKLIIMGQPPKPRAVGFSETTGPRKIQAPPTFKFPFVPFQGAKGDLISDTITHDPVLLRHPYASNIFYADPNQMAFFSK